MTRSVNAVASRRKRKRILKFAKGFWGRRKNVWTVAKNAVEKSWEYAYEGRKHRKRDYRKLWIQRINAGVRSLGYSYSAFINALQKKNIDLNRKVLADMAMNDFSSFEKLVVRAFS